MASTRFPPFNLLFRKLPQPVLLSVKSQNSFLTSFCEVKVNTQFVCVFMLISPRLVRETVASTISKSSFGSFSFTITFQGCFTEHPGVIRHLNCFTQPKACLCNIGYNSPTLCLNSSGLSKWRNEIGRSKDLTSSKALCTFFLSIPSSTSSASAVARAHRTVFIKTLHASAIFLADGDTTHLQLVSTADTLPCSWCNPGFSDQFED